MLKQKYDKKTKEKLYEQYTNLISIYSKENKNLRLKLNDLKATFKLNQDLVYNFINESNDNKSNENNLVNKNKTLWKNYEDLIENIKNIEIKKYKIKEVKENTQIKINEEIKNINNKNKLQNDELIQKEDKVKKLKQELTTTRNKAIYTFAQEEVSIISPTKFSVLKNEELIIGKSIISKVRLMHANIKKIFDNSINEINELKKRLDDIKNNLGPNYNEEELLKISGYKLININDNLMKIDESEDEESLENKQSKDKRKSNKSKMKKYEEMSKELNE